MSREQVITPRNSRRSPFKPWKVLSLSLDDPIPSLQHEPEFDGLYVVFWWHALPLGHVEIPASMLPMPAPYVTDLALQAVAPAVGDHLIDRGFQAPLPIRGNHQALPADLQTLTALDRPLDRLRRRSTPGHYPSEPVISVIVCTRDRPEALRRCLQSLRRLTRRPDEIVVVDNHPESDAVRRLVHQMSDVRFVPEPRPGLSRARNAGLRAANGEIIAFTDDDVTVHPDWLTRVVHAFSDSKIMAVTGFVQTAEIETPAQLEFHRGNGGFGRGFRALTFDTDFFRRTKARGVPVWHLGAGANMAFRRQVFETLGPFDERLGAGASGCSEDSEMWYRILAKGWRCRYEPTAAVYHYHRREMPALREQMYQYMRGHVTALLIQFERYRHWGNLFRAFAILPAYYGKLWLRDVLGVRRPRMTTLHSQMMGCASGILYYWRHRNADRWNRTLGE